MIHAQTYAGGCRVDATTGTSVGEVVNQAHASCEINRGSITITGDLVQQALIAGGVMIGGYHITCSMTASGQYQCTIATSLNGEVVDSFTWGGNAFTWAYACRSVIDDIIDHAQNEAREFCERHDPHFTVGSDGSGGIGVCLELRF